MFTGRTGTTTRDETSTHTRRGCVQLLTSSSSSFLPFFFLLAETKRNKELASLRVCSPPPSGTHSVNAMLHQKANTFWPQSSPSFFRLHSFFFFFLSDHVTKISMCFRVGGKVLFDFICRLPSIFFFCTSLVIPLKEEMKFSFVFYFCVLVTTAFRRLSFSRSSRLHPARMQVLREEEEQDKKNMS